MGSLRIRNPEAVVRREARGALSVQGTAFGSAIQREQMGWTFESAGGRGPQERMLGCGIFPVQ